MENGLYKVKFATALGSGDGVAYLNNGQIHGGDSAIYYVGTYNVDGGTFSAKIKTGRHGSVGIMPSVTGVDNATISINGIQSNGTWQCTGTADAAPAGTLNIAMTRIA